MIGKALRPPRWIGRRLLGTSPPLVELQSQIAKRYKDLVASIPDQSLGSLRFGNKEVELNILFNKLTRDGHDPSEDSHKWSERQRIGRELPKVPTEMSIESMNKYVWELSRLDFKSSPQLMPYVTKIYETLSNSALLTTDSFHLIIAFFGRTYRTLECFRVRDRMVGLGKIPNVQTFNILLDVSLRKNHNARTENALENLRLMEKYELLPNVTTHHVIYRGLRDPLLRARLLEQMCERGVSIRGVAREVAKHELAAGSSVVEVESFLHERGVAATGFEFTQLFVERLLTRGKSEDAWGLALRHMRVNGRAAPSFRVIRQFQWHFIQQNQIYNAVAMIHFLQERFPEFEDRDSWLYLLQRLTYLKGFPHWPLLAKKLYQLNYFTRLASGASEPLLYLDHKDVTAINKFAAGAGAHDGFDVRQKFDSDYESLLMDELFLRLRWHGERPVFKFAENEGDFIEAANVLKSASSSRGSRG